ncbi:hypothetical protein ACWC5F_32025 [Streptomyces sp. NPDC001272]|uniref:hypothetical protein n=1 Tax=Streptomyces sp. NPDC001591 TaxID=3364589 RepID=UPI003692D8CA
MTALYEVARSGRIHRRPGRPAANLTLDTLRQVLAELAAEQGPAGEDLTAPKQIADRAPTPYEIARARVVRAAAAELAASLSAGRGDEPKLAASYPSAGKLQLDGVSGQHRGEQLTVVRLRQTGTAVWSVAVVARVTGATPSATPSAQPAAFPSPSAAADAVRYFQAPVATGAGSGGASAYTALAVPVEVAASERARSPELIHGAMRPALPTDPRTQAVTSFLSAYLTKGGAEPRRSRRNVGVGEPGDQDRPGGRPQQCRNHRRERWYPPPAKVRDPARHGLSPAADQSQRGQGQALGQHAEEEHVRRPGTVVTGSAEIGSPTTRATRHSPAGTASNGTAWAATAAHRGTSGRALTRNRFGMTNMPAGSRADPHRPPLPTAPHMGEAGSYPGPLTRRTDGVRMTDITPDDEAPSWRP